MAKFDLIEKQISRIYLQLHNIHLMFNCSVLFNYYLNLFLQWKNFYPNLRYTNIENLLKCKKSFKMQKYVMKHK